MSKKQIIKDIFKEKINKQEIYHEVISKIEKRTKITSNSVLKYIFIPTFILILTLGIYYETFNQKKIKSEQISNESIYINYIDNYNNEVYDIDGRVEDIDYEKLTKEIPITKIIAVPEYMIVSRIMKSYASGNPNNERYHEFIGYNIIYNIENNTKEIEIFISGTLSEKPRCIKLINQNLKTSTINNNELKLISFENPSSIYYQNHYIVLFEYQNLYFDIETRGITQTELIDLLNSIIKVNNNEK